jgi:outer membrane lipoprotein SlyB
MKGIRSLAGFCAVAALAGCASDPGYYQYGDSRYSEPPRYGYAAAPSYYGNGAYSDYGRVVAIDVVGGPGGSGVGGAIVGGIVGGVLGHQIGSGRGNDAATVAGAVGGAVAGREIDRRRGDEHYRITVELRDGRTATFVQDSLNGLRVGDRVRLADNRLYRD